MVVLGGDHHFFGFVAIQHQSVCLLPAMNVLKAYLQPVQVLIIGGGVPHAEVVVDLLDIGISVVAHRLVARDQRMAGLDIYQEKQAQARTPGTLRHQAAWQSISVFGQRAMTSAIVVLLP